MDERRQTLGRRSVSGGGLSQISPDQKSRRRFRLEDTLGPSRPECRTIRDTTKVPNVPFYYVRSVTMEESDAAVEQPDARAETIAQVRRQNLFNQSSRKARLVLTNARLVSPTAKPTELLVPLQQLFVQEAQEAEACSSNSVANRSTERGSNEDVIRIAFASVLIDLGSQNQSQGRKGDQSSVLAAALAQTTHVLAPFPHCVIAFLARNTPDVAQRQSLTPSQLRTLAFAFSDALEGLGKSDSSPQNLLLRQEKWTELLCLATGSQQSTHNFYSVLQRAVKALQSALGSEADSNAFFTILSRNAGSSPTQASNKNTKPSPTISSSQHEGEGRQTTAVYDAQCQSQGTVILNHLISPVRPWLERVRFAQNHLYAWLAKDSKEHENGEQVQIAFYETLINVTIGILHGSVTSRQKSLLFAALPHLIKELELSRIQSPSGGAKSASDLVHAALVQSLKKTAVRVDTPEYPNREFSSQNVPVDEKASTWAHHVNALVKAFESLGLIRASQANALFAKTTSGHEDIVPQNLLQEWQREQDSRRLPISSVIVADFFDSSLQSDDSNATPAEALFNRLETSTADMLAAREVGSAIVESFHTSIRTATASLDNLALICTALSSHPASLDSILLFRPAEDLLRPLLPILEDEDVLDHLCGPGAGGEDEPGMLSRVVLFMQFLAGQMDTCRVATVLGDCAKHALLPSNLSKAHPLGELDPEIEQPLVSRWIKELLDSDGVGDELIKDSPPRLLLKLTATLFSQLVTAAELGIIDVEMLRNGLSFFLQDLLSYALPVGVRWLMQELRRLKVRQLKGATDQRPTDLAAQLGTEAAQAQARRCDLIASTLCMLLLNDSCPQMALRLVAVELDQLILDGLLTPERGLEASASTVQQPSGAHGGSDPAELTTVTARDADALQAKARINAPEKKDEIFFPTALEAMLQLQEKPTEAGQEEPKNQATYELRLLLSTPLNTTAMSKALASVLRSTVSSANDTSNRQRTAALKRLISSSLFAHIVLPSGLLTHSDVSEREVAMVRSLDVVLGRLDLAKRSTKPLDTLRPTFIPDVVADDVQRIAQRLSVLQSLDESRWEIYIAVLSLTIQQLSVKQFTFPTPTPLHQHADMLALLAWRHVESGLFARHQGSERSFKNLSTETDLQIAFARMERLLALDHSTTHDKKRKRDAADHVARGEVTSSGVKDDSVNASAADWDTSDPVKLAIQKDAAMKNALQDAAARVKRAVLDMRNAQGSTATARNGLNRKDATEADIAIAELSPPPVKQEEQDQEMIAGE